MIEKIRLTLWDIFTFFLTGFLIACILTITFVLLGHYSFNDLMKFIKELPSPILLVVAPLFFTLIGMLIEPPANYFDKYISKYLLWWVVKQKDNHADEEEILKEKIKTTYLGNLNGKIDNPFHLCKEYVETKQLSTTFMVFLSRYGFYRNCSFISMLTGFSLAIYFWSYLHSVLILVTAYILAAIFKKRSEDFYSYMAPAVYRTFLIDKIEWKPHESID